LAGRSKTHQESLEALRGFGQRDGYIFHPIFSRGFPVGVTRHVASCKSVGTPPDARKGTAAGRDPVGRTPLEVCRGRIIAPAIQGILQDIWQADVSQTAGLGCRILK
jgi:hypothetical protein